MWITADLRSNLKSFPVDTFGNGHRKTSHDFVRVAGKAGSVAEHIARDYNRRIVRPCASVALGRIRGRFLTLYRRFRRSDLTKLRGSGRRGNDFAGRRNNGGAAG